MIPGLQSGLSAIRAAQVGLDVSANNLANANTPGYHAQRVLLTEAMPVIRANLSIGTGVEVAEIRRQYDRAIEDQLNQQRAINAAAETYLTLAQRVESTLAPPSGSLGDDIGRFFDVLTELSHEAENPALRRELLNVAESISAGVRTAHQALSDIAAGSEQTIADLVDRANSLVASIEDLSDHIRLEQALGREPNDLLDQRDQLLSELSEIVDVKIDRDGQLFFAARDRWMIGTERGDRIELARNDDGLFLKIDHSDDLFLPLSGKLGGLLNAQNDLVGRQQEALDTFAKTFAGSPESGPCHGNPHR